MKKIINAPDTLVRDMCRGIVETNTELVCDEKYRILYKRNIDQNKVSLISGGGSGHEPAHAGYVGKGMLDAAVCGDVFASPSQIQVYQAIRRTKSPKGTLLIIKNYSGDIMNFKNAAALAEDETEVDYVIVNDDIAVKDSLYTVGRRGVAGTVLVHKVAGAAAELGAELSEVKEAANHAIQNIRSIGFALTSCTVPAKGTPTFAIGEGEMEYGVGIHGEPGIAREEMQPADVLAERMINSLAAELSLKKGDEVSLLVNGFGATPLQELYLFNHAACRQLKKRGIVIHRCFAGNYMTSIDMMGASLTLMKMDARLKELLNAPCNAPGFRMDGPLAEAVDVPEEAERALRDTEVSFGQRVGEDWAVLSGAQLTTENIAYLVDRMGSFIIENETPFCELDSHAGDGDFGMSVAKGFRQLKREWDALMKTGMQDIGTFLCDCAMVIMEYCGGASGPIWGSAFLAAGKRAKNSASLSAQEFYEILAAALKGIKQTGERSFGRGAEVGDKTLVDALSPCVEAWKEASAEGCSLLVCFDRGANAARAGAKATEKIVARMGRAGTVGVRSLGYPDAGAYALGEIFADIAAHLSSVNG